MSRTKAVILGFLVALMSYAYAAPAVASAEGWTVNGTTLTGSQALATTAKIDEEVELTGTNATIKCKGKVLNGVTPQIESPNKGSAKSLIFSECLATVPASCELTTKTLATSPISVGAALEGALAAVVTIGPNTGTLLTTVELAGAECASSGTLPVTGCIRALASTGQDERELQLTSFVTTSSSNLLHIGSDAATLKGSALLKLANGDTWSYK